MVRPGTELAAAARDFVPVRVTDMRGVDLNVFRFNYDLTLAILLMNADGTVYTTYAGRDWTDASSHQSARSLARVLRETRAVHECYSKAPAPPEALPPKTVESLPWFQRRKHDKCYHCHMVNDALQRDGREHARWTERDQYTWPDPAQIGVRIDREGQVVVAEASSGSPAAKAGIRAGDRITSLNNRDTLSFGDIQTALNDAPWEAGPLPVTWTRGDEALRGTIALPPSWKKPTPEQYAWRAMKWPMPPMPGFGGRVLTADERRKLGLDPANFAFSVDYIVTWGPNRATGANAMQAGIRKGMVVHDVDGKTDFSDINHFHAWFRMTRQPGRPVRIGVIRNGTRQTVTLTPAQ